MSHARRARILATVATMSLALACASTSAQRDRELRKSIAMELVAQRDWQGAFEKIQELHVEDPDDADVLTMRGIMFREQGLPQEAEADLRAAIEIDDERADAHSALAVILEAQGRGPEAIEHHRRAADISPDSPELLNNLAFALFARNKLDESVAKFNEALRLDPTNARIRNNLGFAHARRGDFGRAAREFANAGTPAQAKNNLGFAYERAGNLAAAYDLYQQALELQPGLEQARHNLANVARATGRPGPDEPSTQENQGGLDETSQPD